MSALTITLFNPNEASLNKPIYSSSPTSDDEERQAPFTTSPLSDTKVRKCRVLVRDAPASNTKEKATAKSKARKAD
jgi:hypothetical protein